MSGKPGYRGGDRNYHRNPPACHHGRNDVDRYSDRGFFEQPPVERQNGIFDRRDHSSIANFGDEETLKKDRDCVWRCHPDMFAQSIVNHYPPGQCSSEATGGVGLTPHGGYKTKYRGKNLIAR